MKAHGKGKGINITSQFTSTLNRFKGCIANVSDGVPVREFVPYVPSKAMERAVARCKELTALPSRFA